MGTSRVEFNGGTEATLTGDSYVAKAGIEVKLTDRVYWLASVQNSYFKARDNTSRMETRTNEVYTGINIRTGRK